MLQITKENKRNYIIGGVLAVAIVALIIVGVVLGGKNSDNNLAKSITVDESVAIVNNLENQLVGGEAGKCYNNMWELNIRSQSWIADKNNKGTPPKDISGWIEAFGIVPLTCPVANSTYSMDNKGNVTCSTHGTIATLKVEVENAGMMTVDNVDSAISAANGKFISKDFMANLKSAFKLPAESAKVIDNYALLNGFIYALSSADVNTNGEYTVENNALILSGNDYITSLIYKNVDGKWLLDNIVFNGNFISGTPSEEATSTK